MVTRKVLAWNALQIFALLNFVVAQPLFMVLQSFPTISAFFVSHHALPIDIVLLVAAVSFVLPLLLVLLELVSACIGSRCYRVVHLFLMGTLTFLGSLLLLGKLSNEYSYARFLSAVEDVLLPVIAVLLTIGFVRSYTRSEKPRTFVTLLSPGIVLFPAYFLFYSPVADLTIRKEPERIGEAVTVSKPAPVVFILFDELNGMSLVNEQHQINAIRYPNFARFADGANWFRNATTSSAHTTYAVPSMLTGKAPDPDQESIPDRVHYPDSLFSLLYNSHRLHVFESATGLCPRSPNLDLFPLQTRVRALILDAAIVYAKIVTPKGKRHLWPDTRGGVGNFSRPLIDDSPSMPLEERIHYYGRLGQFRRFLEDITPYEGDTLYFLHIMLPHVDYEYLPSGRAYDGPPIDRTIGFGYRGDHWHNDELAVLHAQQRYLLQLECVDRMVGELVVHLHKVGLYDRSVIVLASDHGVSFQSGDSRREITKRTVQDVLPILLMIKTPGQQQRVVSDRNVESIDVLPTIADALGITVPWPTAGQSALDSSAPQRLRKQSQLWNNMLVFQADFDIKYRSAAQQAERFGDGANANDLFRIGPHSDLVGRKVDEFNLLSVSDVTVSIDNREALDRTVYPTRLLLPCQLRGRIEAPSERERAGKLAFAVNGVIRGTTRTYQIDGHEDVWFVMLPEDAVQAGGFDLQVFVVSEVRGAVCLSPARVSD